MEIIKLERTITVIKYLLFELNSILEMVEIKLIQFEEPRKKD